MPAHDQESVLSRRRFLAAAAATGAACAGALAVPSIAGARPAAAATSYTLKVTNDSTGYQSFCLYQKPVGLGVPGALPLAWMVAPLWPRRSTTFTWSLDYSFSWAVTGPLAPGGTFQPWQQVAAYPENESRNRIGFDFDNGLYEFVPPASGGSPQLGSLGIEVHADVPDDTASVGIGMASGPVFAAQAEPGANPVFTPHPQYWIAAGAFTRGQIMDIEEITNEIEVPFVDTFSMQAVLGAADQWSVLPG